MYKYSVYKRQ